MLIKHVPERYQDGLMREFLRKSYKARSPEAASDTLNRALRLSVWLSGMAMRLRSNRTETFLASGKKNALPAANVPPARRRPAWGYGFGV